MNKPLAEPVVQAVLVEQGIARHYGCGNVLAALGIGQSTNSAFLDAGTFAQHALYHLWIDVVAAGNNQIVLAADEHEESGRITAAEIARVEPAVLHAGARCLGII